MVDDAHIHGLTLAVATGPTQTYAAPTPRTTETTDCQGSATGCGDPG
ncbi:hypothetical protein XA26_17730 [Mycolicibacterium fortuitum]|uniref:Uncharacterized protein n=1 Tax=Mycolicibacterium fortuitum TaxID=1766 RepID=A0A0N9XH83_MYCFO|nr:hypothetical protein G155_00107 [Mycobacterium sp. VKM Ac-1817D]ALI25620.1 hypothetical protein XA26_17730 [Mycolicibacterium fortuitum]